MDSAPSIRAAAVFSVALLLGPAGGAQETMTPKWRPIELSFPGPSSKGRGDPSPFAVRLDVVFTSPSGRRQSVPGFYDGDGRGGLDGDVWKARFAADEAGRWTYTTKSREKSLDGKTGAVRVTEVAADAQGLWKWGRLESTGSRYLKFRDGPHWLKAGCDDPENFLGRYRHFDTLAKRKAAVDYLAAKGVNSMYIMTHNLGGDDRDVWPWLGATAKQAMAHGGDDARFDVAKLDQWRRLFEHMQDRGVVLYLVLEDDSAWKGYDHQRYYREIVARFGDLPGLVFNLGEEHNENYRLPAGLELARQFGAVDSYGHPLGIHNVNRPNDAYIDSRDIDFTAIQTGSPGSRRGLKNAMEHNRLALQWLARCRERGRSLMVGFDEGRPEHDRRAWWSAYLGGAVWEAHVLQPYDRPLDAWDQVWTELGGARAFMESLPFWELTPSNELIRRGTAFCLAKPGEAYAVYLPEGGSIELQLPGAGQFQVDGWDPAQGADGRFQSMGLIPGGLRKLQAPGKGDWALRIRRSGR